MQTAKKYKALTFPLTRKARSALIAKFRTWAKDKTIDKSLQIESERGTQAIISIGVFFDDSLGFHTEGQGRNIIINSDDILYGKFGKTRCGLYYKGAEGDIRAVMISVA